MAEYAPFPLETDARTLGLVTTTARGTAGSLVLHHRPQPGAHATVLLHGAAGSWTTWTPLLRAADIAEPVLLDLPGWGDGQLDDDAGLDEVAQLVHDGLLAAGCTTWDLVGHSLGGFLALDLASRWPDRVRSVTMVSGTTWSIIEGRVPAFTGLLATMRVLGRALPALARGLDRVGLLRLAVAPLFRHPLRVPRSVVEALAREVRPRAFVRAAQIARRYPADDRWSTIGCAVTALQGDRDVFARRSDLDRLVATIPQARTVLVAECGHFANVEHPHLVARELPPGSAIR